MNVLFLAYALPDIIYTLAVGSAVSLFLAFYITLLIAQARRVTVVETVKVPSWLFWITPMYSGWLDKLTVWHLVKAFIKALSVAVVLWTVLMSLLLVVLAKVYSP